MSYPEEKSGYSKQSSKLQKPQDDSSSSADWSSSYSSHSSLSGSDCSDSFIPEWEPFVQEDGSLFYIEYNCQKTQPKQHQPKNTLNAARNSFNRASTRRSKKARSKLSKLINRNIKPVSKTPVKPVLSNTDSSKVKFSEISEGEIKRIAVVIDPSMRHKFGRRASVCEAILGVSICPFPDGHRVMIAGYMPNSVLSQDKIIKVGDWLKTINDEEVTSENVDLILLGFAESTEIILTLQRMAGEEPAQLQHTLTNKVTSINDFAVNARMLFGLDQKESQDADFIFSVMYLTMRETDNSDLETVNVLFCYPPVESNRLYTSRGTFLTLNSLLQTTFNSIPTATTVMLDDIEYHVYYKGFNEDLFLVAISSEYATLQETKLKTIEIMKCMEFLFQTIPEAIEQANIWNEMFEITKLIYLTKHRNGNILFENSLLEPHYIPLPKEAQLRIDDALGEMEAMDYREWNEEPLKSHREFYITGSALYFKSYLLATHLPPSDLIDVESFLRVQGILTLIDAQAIRDLVTWQEIYPKSVERGLVQQNGIYGIPAGRWFLAVVARNHMLLAVILESRHGLMSSENDNSDEHVYISPSSFYIEEIQDTLEHLRSGSIENLASTWVSCNKRPQVIQENITPDCTTTPALVNTVPLKTEIISILKRRNNSMENVGETTKASTSLGGSSLNSQTFSEDSNKKTEDDESDSDWDGFPDSQRSSSCLDVSDVTETLLKEVSDIVPSKITAGIENVLFHYVQIEVGDGILLSPTGMTSNREVIQAFRKACLLIHTIFQNTIRFRYLLSQESSKPNSHRSLVAIKEHGVLINIFTEQEQQMEFWVIGRLFSLPQKELFVCHLSNVPQNLIEIAFRLVLNAAG